VKAALQLLHRCAAAARMARSVDEPYADVTALQPVARSRLLRPRGLLTRDEINRLGRQITIYLGL